MLWFNIIPGIIFIILCFFLMILSLEQRKNRVTNTGFTILQQHNLKKLKKKTADKKEVKPSSDSKMIKRLTCFRHHDILTTTRSRMTTAIRFSRQNDTGSCAHTTRLVIVLVLEPKAMLTLEPIFVPTLKVIRYSMNTYPICDFRDGPAAASLP